MNRLAIILIFTILLSTTAWAGTAHEQAMSYILADQDKPTKPGDRLYTSEVSENCPVLLETTAYCMGTHGSHGDRMKRGYAAYTAASYGTEMELYEADLQKDGSYTLGAYIGRYQIKDTGFGRETGKGCSKIKPNKSKGTIEVGLCIDIYTPNYAECKEWMRDTQGKVFALIIEDIKG